jgi:hypothetical protein
MRWLWAPPQYLTDQDWMIVPIGEHRVLVLVGRVHAYQGHDLRHVVHPVRAAGAGARIVVLTNAAGGLRPGPGDRPAGADQRPPQPDGAVTASRRPVRGPHRRLCTPAAAARPTRTDEVLRRYVVIETSGQKVCNFFVCMTTMLSISRLRPCLMPSEQRAPVPRSFARLRNEALKDRAERR